MAATQLVLKTYYGNVMRSDFAHIPAAHQTLLANLSTQVDGGAISLADAQAQIRTLAASTTSVASMAYSFFTGGTPFAGGFDYLISASGSNPTNLNSAYYQTFNVENRFINFAMNLGKSGEGATWFGANYGGLTTRQTLIKAYTEVFGLAPSDAKVDGLLGDMVSDGRGGTFTRQAYFAAFSGDGLEGQGTKAAIVGWLLSVAVKEDLGTYAKANDAFLLDLADDGVARFRAGLLAGYGTQAPGSAGATITVTADQSVSPTSTSAALKSTAGNDTITGTAGLSAGQIIDGGAGNDTLSLTGTIYGKIVEGDGNNTITLGSLGATTATLGVPAQYGSVTLGSGNNTVTLKGVMAEGTSLTATGSNNVLHIEPGAGTAGTISGFQTVYVHGSGNPIIAGAAVIYDVVKASDYAGTVSISARGNEIVVLQDTSNAVNLYTTGRADGRKLEVHLQNFKGAPYSETSAGGAIYMENFSPYDGPFDTKGGLILHVDSDSTAGLIYGWSTSSALGPNYKGVLPNLTIIGPGKLTAQLAVFSNVDATQAGDLTISYHVDNSVDGQTVRLGNGTNIVKLDFQTVTPGWIDLTSSKIYLGGGTDTLILAGKYLEDPSTGPQISTATLSNLHIKGGATPTLSTPPEILNFQKGVDHLVLDALIHNLTANVQQYADGKASLQAAVIDVSAHTALNTAAIFTWNGDTYIYSQDGRAGVNMGDPPVGGDGLIKLVGVTGLTVGTGAGSYDIHYG